MNTVSKHYPKEYLAQEVTFLGKTFYIDERAYIPNVETQTLVQTVIDSVTNEKTILDVGTGSGVIAISLAKRFPSMQIFGVDKDEEALQVAEINKAKHQASNVRFIPSEYADNLELPEPGIVVADLPWGGSSNILKSNTLEKLSFMPDVAIFHPGGPMGAYRELMQSISRREWRTTLYFESGTMSEKQVGRGIPVGLSWEYIPYESYSVTKVLFP